MRTLLRASCLIAIVAFSVHYLFFANASAEVDEQRKKRIEEEICKMNSEVAANPGQAQPYFTRALLHRAHELWEPAIEDYSSAIAKHLRGEFLDDAYEGRGICYMNLGRNKEAIADFHFALKLNPHSYDARKSLALVLLRMGYAERARDQLTNVLALKGQERNASILALRARARNSLKDYAGALNDADQSLSCDPNNVDAVQERAKAHIGLKDPQKAITELTAAIARFPRRGSLWAALALAYYAKGDYQQTVLNTNKALELRYQSAELLASGADSYERLGQHDHCVSMATSSIGLNPSEGLAYFVRGHALRHLQRGDLARADLRRAEELGFKGR